MKGGIQHSAFMEHLWLFVLSIYLLAGSIPSLSQTVPIGDPEFRNFLKTKYPATVDADGNLVLAEAAKVGGVVNGSNLPITSIDGIQYFTSARSISFVSCSLSVLPDISNLVQLSAINVMYNRIESLPELSKLKRLKVLNVHYNNLQRIPSLSQNDSLIELKVNNNRLDSMPELSKLIRLQRLIIHSNRISELKGLDKLADLVEFWCGSNQLGNFPDLSALANIQYFDASNNRLTQAPSFGNNAKIQTLLLHQNNIASLPNFTTYKELKKVSLYQNKLTFKELIKVTPIARYDTIFHVSPQQILTIGKPLELLEGTSFVFATGVDKEIDKVEYHWFKKGQPAASVKSDAWRVPLVHGNDSGAYTVQLGHPAFPDLRLQTDAFYVSVLPCIDISSVFIATTEINCIKTGTVEVTLPATDPADLHYQLQSVASGKVHQSNTGRFAGLSEPSYKLSISNAAGCSKEYPTEIKIATTKCKDYLVTPDNDGNADTFFFEASGKAEIYDKRGNLVKRLTIPGEWDCFSDKGKVASGYYIANINDGESQIGLSVVY